MTSYPVASYADDYSFEINRWFLKPIGAWPVTEIASLPEKILSRSLSLTCSVLIGSVMITVILNTLLEEKDFGTKLKTAGPISFWLMAAMKYCLLLIHGKDIRVCIDHMRQDWIKIGNDDEDRNIMLKNAKTGRYIAGFCGICMHTGIFCYIIVMPISAGISLSSESNYTVKLLPYPFYNRIADTRYSPAYEIVYSIQALSGFVVNSVTVGACSLAAVFVMHACGQLEVLMVWLEKFACAKKTRGEKNREFKISDIVIHHLRTLSFISNIEQIMHQICLVELVGCTLNICFIGYYLITEWEQNGTRNLIAYSILLVSFSFNIFIFCYIGEKLIEQCLQIGEAAYMTNWYQLRGKTALDFILIIAVSNSAVRLTAGKLIKLSIATFGDVIKTSLTYLNILRRVTS